MELKLQNTKIENKLNFSLYYNIIGYVDYKYFRRFYKHYGDYWQSDVICTG